MPTFLERLQDPRPLLYDGGFGTQLFNRDIKLANSALANDLHPDAVVDIHSAYIASGADIIGTNTFVASPLHLDMAGVEGEKVEILVRLAVEHAQAAREQSGRPVFIAGSIGPSPGAVEADSGDTDFGIPNQKAREAHERVATTLAEGGVDFFCVETMFSAKEAAMAVDVVRSFGLPIAVNLTYKYTRDRSTGDVIYKTDWGHSATSLLDFLASGEFSDHDNLLDHVHILGTNCGAESRRVEHTGMPYAILGTQQLGDAMQAHGMEPKRMMAYPNAGIPELDDQHQTVYRQTPEEMAGQVPALLDAGTYLIGGCCGTGPEHIRAFRAAMDDRGQGS